MKKILLVFVCLFASIYVGANAPIRVACIGDSITFGARVEDRINNSYPVQLSRMLGDGYVVENFGVSSTTLLSTTDKPYVKTKQYEQVFTFKPDFIFICLGTNDSKGMYRDLMDNFEADYKALIKSFEDKLPGVEIVILASPKAHNTVGRQKIEPEYLTNTIIGKIQQVAFDTNLDIMNLHPLFDEWEEGLMPDKVHPSAAGASIIAQRVHEYLVTKDKKHEFCFDKDLKNAKNFYGYKSYDFTFEGKASKVVVPRTAAEGNPWVWRARFWDRKITDVDQALLERGYHIVYNHVANMFGNDKAVSQWEKFYDYVVSKGLNEKCVIECISRGGLIAYNFAAKNPEKVSVIFADAPVMDIKSWPLSHEKEKLMTKKLLEVYGFENREQAMEYKGNPIDKAELIAKSGIKLIHVIGDADVLVPIKDNTLPFAELIRQAGGKITVYSKPGCDHHPHGYYHKADKGVVYPNPIVAEILRSCNLAVSEADVPRIGYRKRGDNTWLDIAKEIKDSVNTNKYDILLLGNSITQGFGSERKLLSSATRGFAPMNEAFPKKTWFSAGISADRTQHLLHRVLFDGYENCEPKYVVITIGVNNLNHDRSDATETIEGIQACVDAVKLKMPKAKILLFGLLPSRKHFETSKPICEQLEKLYAKDKKVTYVNPYPHFAPNGENVEAKYYVKDKLHLSDEGYQMWTKLMTKYIK